MTLRIEARRRKDEQERAAEDRLARAQEREDERQRWADERQDRATERDDRERERRDEAARYRLARSLRFSSGAARRARRCAREVQASRGPSVTIVPVAAHGADLNRRERHARAVHGAARRHLRLGAATTAG